MGPDEQGEERSILNATPFRSVNVLVGADAHCVSGESEMWQWFSRRPPYLTMYAKPNAHGMQCYTACVLGSTSAPSSSTVSLTCDNNRGKPRPS